MKLFNISFVLSIVGICGAIAQDALPPASVEPGEANRALEPLENRSGWVNPEDLAPMPQCVAQQDQSTWLSAMTRCTGKQCTRHFGASCTHHQWLTQLSCLSKEMSPALVQSYFPYCSRSVLAKAQLYRWIHAVTSRTWLVDVGDAMGLQTLSPASLAKGYAEVDVAYKAPTCLADSASASSMEPFQFVMASCGFTGTTQHTGNAGRPWEYSEAQHSIIALDSETASYDAIPWHWVASGDYFDKHCFCKAFTKDSERESCSGTGLALTKERMWMNATCGPDSLPNNWTDGIKTTAFNYIPTAVWRWPACVNNMPEEVIELTDQCAADACEVDSDGYCKVTSAVDRTCFCRNISYDTCKGPCHFFEPRIDYVKWLHNLCGRVDGWDGLPDNWRQLSAITPLDTIPRQWRLTDSGNSTQTCASTEWKLASLVLINTGTILAVIFSPRTETTRTHVPISYPSSWFTMGAAIVALHLFANSINAMLVQSTPGHTNIPITQLILLWCSMPRSTWLTILLTILQPPKTTAFPTILAGYLFAETILQLLSASHMLTTISYGWHHAFYTNKMVVLDPLPSAKAMYIGALLWLLIVIVALVLVLQALASDTTIPPSYEKQSHPTVAEELVATPLMTTPCTSYGTHPDRVFHVAFTKRSNVRLVLIASASLFLLSVAQWVFWIGFLGVGDDVFCPPRLEVLTGVWIAAAVVVMRLK